MLAKTYAANDLHLIQLYLEGREIQFQGYGKDWATVAPYKKPSDIFRLSNQKFTFRLAPVDIHGYIY